MEHDITAVPAVERISTTTTMEGTPTVRTAAPEGHAPWPVSSAGVPRSPTTTSPWFASGGPTRGSAVTGPRSARPLFLAGSK